MKIKDLLTSKNEELFKRVSKNFEFDDELTKSEGDSWGSYVKGKKAIITFSETNFPESCFVHELLHFDTQIKGYKRLKTGVSGFDQTDYFPKLMTAFDNELQHHKMFPEFVKLNYPQEQFYIDHDTGTENQLKSYLTSNTINFKSSFLNYLTLIAPGGSVSEKTKEELKEIFKLLDSNKHRDFFNNLEKQFSEWTKTTSMNAEPFINEIFKTISGGDMTWFGYGEPKEFPNNGFFVDKVFEMENP